MNESSSVPHGWPTCEKTSRSVRHARIATTTAMGAAGKNRSTASQSASKLSRGRVMATLAREAARSGAFASYHPARETVCRRSAAAGWRQDRRARRRARRVDRARARTGARRLHLRARRRRDGGRACSGSRSGGNGRSIVDGRLAKHGVAKRARVFAEDAKVALPRLGPDASVRRVFSHFPDPWWKKRHEKRIMLRARARERGRAPARAERRALRADGRRRARRASRGAPRRGRALRARWRRRDLAARRRTRTSREARASAARSPTVFRFSNPLHEARVGLAKSLRVGSTCRSACAPHRFSRTRDACPIAPSLPRWLRWRLPDRRPCPRPPRAR